MEDIFFRGIQSKEFSSEELLLQVGKFPRDAQKIVLCHGTFDIVHPGHLRQFAFAKTQGEKLVVSITADRFIAKSGVKPYVPQEIRSINLSALEIVDYVLVCESETPLEMLKKLQPEVFVKGYDYSSEENSKTIEEKQVVEAYGGKMVFSPGDFVMSSTRLIESRNFNLSLEKLQVLMKQEKVSIRDFTNCLSSFPKHRVSILGDTIVDQINYSKMIGASGKTPTLSTRKIKSERFVGGAAIVAMHVAAAGADPRFISVIGDDQEGEFVRESLEKLKINNSLFFEIGRPTTLKESFDVDGYRLLKIDRVSNAPIGASTLMKIVDALKNAKADTYIFSDFRHGVFDSSTARKFFGEVPSGSVVAADSQVASRWGNILDFKGAELVTVNEKEARYSLGNQDLPIRPLGENLFREMNAKILILKVGRDGAITFRRALEGSDPRHFFVLDSFARYVRDAVGAGDALLAYSSIAWSITKNPLIATFIGLIAAGIECEHEGNIPIERRLVEQRIQELGLP